MTELQRRQLIHIGALTTGLGIAIALVINSIQYLGYTRLIEILGFAVGFILAVAVPFVAWFLVGALLHNYDRIQQLKKESEENNHE